MTTRTAKTPSKMAPTPLPGMAVPSVYFDRGRPSLAMVMSDVEAYLKLALTLSADPFWAVPQAGGSRDPVKAASAAKAPS